jgi:hypothetical protein
MEASGIKIIARKCETFKALHDQELDLVLFYGEDQARKHLAGYYESANK